MFKTAKKRLGSFQSPLKEMQKPLYYRRENAVLSPRRIPSAAADGGSSIFSFISGEKIAPGKKVIYVHCGCGTRPKRLLRIHQSRIMHGFHVFRASFRTEVE